MAFSTYYSDFRDHAFAWALTLSIGLHVLALTYLPNIHFDKLAPPRILEVDLAMPEKPQPEPANIPEPVNTPEPTAEPREPQIKPKPAPKLVQTPSPVAEPPPNPRPEPPAAPTAPAVITAPAKSETPPAFTAPPPPPEPPKEPPKPSAPNQQDIDAARNLYGSLLGREIAKHKQYPKVAQIRGWQGEATVELQIDGSGNMLSSKIHDSSGYEVLDKQALEMVKKASPFPSPPDALRGRTFNILVPVSFRLE